MVMSMRRSLPIPLHWLSSFSNLNALNYKLPIRMYDPLSQLLLLLFAKSQSIVTVDIDAMEFMMRRMFYISLIF